MTRQQAMAFAMVASFFVLVLPALLFVGYPMWWHTKDIVFAYWGF